MECPYRFNQLFDNTKCIGSRCIGFIMYQSVSEPSKEPYPRCQIFDLNLPIELKEEPSCKFDEEEWIYDAKEDRFTKGDYSIHCFQMLDEWTLFKNGNDKVVLSPTSITVKYILNLADKEIKKQEINID